MNYDPRHFIANARWRFAKTMPDNPHWYAVERDEERAGRGDALRAFVAFLKDTGTDAKYGGHRYRYVEVDGFTYWLTWAKGARYIVNRKPTSEAGWDE